MMLDELKTAFRISAAWRDVGLPGEPPKTCRSPFPTGHKHGDAGYSKLAGIRKPGSVRGAIFVHLPSLLTFIRDAMERQTKRKEGI